MHRLLSSIHLCVCAVCVCEKGSDRYIFAPCQEHWLTDKRQCTHHTRTRTHTHTHTHTHTQPQTHAYTHKHMRAHTRPLSERKNLHPLLPLAPPITLTNTTSLNLALFLLYFFFLSTHMVTHGSPPGTCFTNRNSRLSFYHHPIHRHWLNTHLEAFQAQHKHASAFDLVVLSPLLSISHRTAVDLSQKVLNNIGFEAEKTLCQHQAKQS